MVPKDPYIDPGGEEGEGREEGRSQDEEGGSQDSSFDDTGYTGNVSQWFQPPPLTMPRHNAVLAFTAFTNIAGIPYSNVPQVWIIKAPTGPNGSTGYDQVSSFIDITGDGISPVAHDLTSWFQITYNGTAVQSEQYATERTYRAYFASGHTEDFTVLVPGQLQNLLGGNFGLTTYTCNTPINPFDFMFTAIGGGGGTPTLVPTWIYGQTNIINNPSNVYHNGSIYYNNGNNSSLDITASSSASDNFHLMNAAGGGGSGYIALPDPGQAAVQKIASLAIQVDSNSVEHTTFLGAPSGFSWPVINSNLRGTGDKWELPFIYLVDYTENLPSCADPIYTVDGCTDVNNMAFYGYTGEDCAGVAILASILLDPSTATWTPGSCCPTCISTSYVSDPTNYSSQPLMLSAVGTNPLTVSGTTGYIDATILDGGFDSNGAPQGLPTGNANYTYVVKNQDLLDTMCGNTAGLGVGSGAVNKNSFTFGHTVPLNVNGGLLQTGAIGNATYATSSAQGYVPAITGTTNSEGFRAGTYDVYVFDASGTVCLGRTVVILEDPLPTIGCKDSAALNYDSSFTIADNTNCHYCEATTGELIDGNTPANIVDDITATSASPFIITNPTTTTSTDSVINISGITPTTLFQAYINNILSGTTQNADYIIELYKWDSQTPTGNSAFGTLVGFNAGTTIVGSAVNNQSNGWNATLDSSTLTTGFTYGYYSIKVYISDPDATVEIEECYEIFDVIVPVPVCLDSSSGSPIATASDSVIVTDANLYVHDSALCSTVRCCDTPFFLQHITSTVCDLKYSSEITCTPLATSLIYTLQYYDSGSWVNVGTSTTIANPSSPYNTGTVFTNTIFNTYGSGDYRVEWISQYASSPDCIVYTPTVNVPGGQTGCMDPIALNYNASAVCNDGCIYCVDGCMNPLATNYDPNATCDDGSCIIDVLGCTDPIATNYDPLATIDDGSCIYPPCGCTDPIALNYDPTVTCDDGSCTYCDDPPLTYTYTTTNATVIAGTCNSNLDGCINLTVDSSSCTTTWTLVECFFFCGISNSNVNLVTSTDYSYGVVANICNLAGGHTYTLTLEDCNGCLMQIDIFVGTDSTDCGCTDPNATNYDPTATIDDGSCQFCGCTDDTAINYNPAATSNCTPDTCIYPNLTPPCIPPHIDQVFDKLKLCIADNGFSYHNKLIIGLIDDCSIMNVWKLILIDYLLGRIGLDCIYNCADISTPDASDIYTSCDDIWVTGGPSTGLNDTAVSGTGVGTTSTVAMFYTSGTLSPGDIIKHHNSDNIWIFDGPPQNGPPSPVSVVGLDPENATGNLSGYWRYCNDSLRYININNINYIDKFINFANTFCRDCENNLSSFEATGRTTSYSVSRTGVDGIDGIDI